MRATADILEDFLRVYEFGRFRLDPGERRLFHAGATVALMPKMLEMLIALVEIAGNLPPAIMAVLHLASGQRHEVIRWVRKAIDEHDPNIFGLATDSVWIAMRGWPEYRAALSRIGLGAKPAEVLVSGG